MLNRRQFLTHCSGAATVVLLPAAALASGHDGVRLSRQLFAALIGQSFRGFDERNLALNFLLLDIVQDTRNPELDQFTLVFKETYRIGQQRSGGLYRMVHPDLGQLLMYLVPSVRGPRAYTSSFCLLT